MKQVTVVNSQQQFLKIPLKAKLAFNYRSENLISHYAQGLTHLGFQPRLFQGSFLLPSYPEREANVFSL